MLQEQVAEQAVVSDQSDAPEGDPVQTVALIDLTRQMCRWPIGDPKSEHFGFCGARREGLSPYCQHHHGIAYQSAAKS
jgi:hypothetical protein